MITQKQMYARTRNFFLLWASRTIGMINTFSQKNCIYPNEKYFLLSLIKEMKKFINMVKENNKHDENNKS